MGVVREVRLFERTTRRRLAVRHHPYWRMISEGAHIGYYRGPRGGKWVARYREAGSNEPYATLSLGTADDMVEADGEMVLNYKQALDKANAWIKQQANGGRTLNPNLTVRDAIKAYIEIRDARVAAHGGKHSSGYYTLNKYALPDRTLCRIKLCDLSEAELRGWQRRLKGVGATTKQRVVTDLKAALNLAFEEHRRALPSDLPITIKYGLKPVFVDDAPSEPARDNQVLADDQIRRILAKGKEMDEDGDHFLLTMLLAATGARFSQVTRMLVGDVQPEFKRVMVPPSRKGRGRKPGKPIPVRVGPDVLAVLEGTAEGRKASEPLLVRWRYRQISPTKWVRVDRRAWTSSSEMSRWWAEIVKAAGCPGVIPYALRHSSIVRAIRNGLPIRLVAALHDTSVAMIEKHYARWITESLDELAAQAVVPLLHAA
ncbi:tyrosine-type recombinase/integrase [Sphingomonas quercus]|uniref:Tyrosine-type recombinase/integrase n=1 Tax=Sphingomonas quercus TaxID=2842451 RepID=A0ABS6BKM6_9SPHN|nr:tyrosine-type recombinase/integrase [Sphingomonas quercus]MBU3078853.1 tyrosine-type recombinase/integrase [Sphingomonas quercus]